MPGQDETGDLWHLTGGEKRVKELEELGRAPAREAHVASGSIQGRRAGEGTSEAAVQVQDVTARRTGPA